MFKRVIKEELKIPAEIGYLGDLRDFITREGRKYGLTENVINAFKLAIDEAGTNIVRHAYRDWDGFITMRMIIREKEVTITLIDQGHAFDPRNVSDPDLQRYVDIGKKGGLGVFIIRRVIDDIEYRKTEEGNELSLTKQREVVSKKFNIIPEFSFSMKVKYFFIATSVISPAIILLFFLNFSGIKTNILKADITAGWVLARSVTNQSLESLAGEKDWELSVIAAEFCRNHSPHVRDVIIVSMDGIILGTSRTDELLLQPFHIPGNRQKFDENIFEYDLADGTRVLDLFNPAIQNTSQIRLGDVHLLMDKNVIDSSIMSEKRSTLLFYGMLLLLSNIGIALLIYLTMSPFKRLAAWVRELGQGGASDDMEFDSSDEIGEIALAFNEITEKFRKSQVNLAEQERLQKEMQVAQEIQQTLLPDSFPDIEGFEIASYYEAAKEVGGDYYDFVEVDNDTLGIVVADVSGKGVPGSLVMTMIRTALRTEARGNKDAADVLARVNEFVTGDMKRGMFVTVFYIILDSKNRTINYASAGHNPMILYRSSTCKSYYLNPRGFPIGINLPEKSLFRKSIESDMLRLQEGDALFLYTDGITEAMNPRREQFGDERFLKEIRKLGEENIEDKVEKLHNSIEIFTEGFAQNDDITLVAVREKMKAEDVLFNFRMRLLKMVDDGATVKAACKAFNVSTSTYYKYKKRFVKDGEKGLKEVVSRSDIEEKHISIEDKAKITDIIREHPDFGPKRISDELNTEKYNYTILESKQIYEDLKRSRLNTKDLRLAFIEKGKTGKKFKPPGTPMLTLSGEVIVSNQPEKKPLPFARPIEDETEKEVAEELAANLNWEDEFSVDELIDGAILPNGFNVEDENKDEVDSSFENTESQEDHFEMVTGERIEELFGDDGADENIDDGPIPVEKIEEKNSKNESLPEIVSNVDIATDDFHDELEDDIFNVLLTDTSELEDSTDDEEVSGQQYLDEVTLDEVLAIDEGEFQIVEQENAVEDGISTSIAGELFDDEIGTMDIIDNNSDLDSVPNISTLDTATASVPTIIPQESFRSGLGLYKEGEYQRAIDEFVSITKFDPTHGPAYQYLGDAYFRIGELEQAIHAYENARDLQPENMNIMENMGVIFANMGDFKKAVWQWGEVLKNDPDRSDIVERIKKMQRMIRQRFL